MNDTERFDAEAELFIQRMMRELPLQNTSINLDIRNIVFLGQELRKAIQSGDPEKMRIAARGWDLGLLQTRGGRTLEQELMRLEQKRSVNPP